jgi:hypothetical protein
MNQSTWAPKSPAAQQEDPASDNAADPEAYPILITSIEGNDPTSNVYYDPLPDLDPNNDMDIDFDDTAALLAYSKNNASAADFHVHDAGDEVSNVENSGNNSPEPLGTVVNDDNNVEDMNWNDVLDRGKDDTDKAVAKAFAKLRRSYESKKAAGTNTQIDDIRFEAEQGAEDRRLRDLERSLMDAPDFPEPINYTEGIITDDPKLLFVPEDSPEVAQTKPTKKKRAPAKGKGGLSNSEVGDAISQGVQSGYSAARSRKRKGAKASSEEPAPKKRRQTANTAGAKKPKKGGSRKQRPEMSNIESLGRTNIVQAARANESKPDMPNFKAKNKDKALRELISSIPSVERGSATSDSHAVLEATRKFNGRGAMRSDGKGGWILKGMQTSLYNHQLLGTAFLRERETGESKPQGGMIRDEMGFGKTIQMIANMIDGKPTPESIIKTTLVIAPPTLLNQ